MKIQATICVAFFFLFCVTVKSQNLLYKYDNINRLAEIKYNDGTTIKYFYDAVGNRSKNIFSDSFICPRASTFFEAKSIEPGNTFQWQANTGGGFSNLSESATYGGVNTNLLSLNNLSTSLYGSQYRCVITNGPTTRIEDPFVLRFAMIWTGKEDTAWENPANWSCNSLPDANTDVTIETGVEHFPVVSSKAFCRTLVVNRVAQIKIASGYNLTVTAQ
jgi:YD repeat-containing protein